MQVTGNYAKRKHLTHDIMTGRQLQVNKRRIKLFHKLLFTDPKITLDFEQMRTGNLDRKQREEELKLEELQERQ